MSDEFYLRDEDETCQIDKIICERKDGCAKCPFNIDKFCNKRT